MNLKITTHHEGHRIPKSEPKGELMRAIAELKKNQSLNVPESYMRESKNKRALIAVSCLRVGGPGAFAVRKQDNGSFEVYRVT